VTPDAYLHAVVRILALVLWVAVVIRTRGQAPDRTEEQARRWASTLLVLALMVALVVGSLVNFGLLPIEVSRIVYSAVAAMVSIVAAAILSLLGDDE
jgi:cytochrome bd-type quinol oxidase subunit 2